MTRPTAQAHGPVHAEAMPPPRQARELVEPDLPRTAKVRTGALRTGYTTGACATAAAKAATLLLATGQPPRTVEILLPAGHRVSFPVDDCRYLQADTTEAVVVKDAGDDPDVTHGARLTATVAWADEPGVHLWGGDGVGVVTKPGLGLEIGGPAINGTPRHMIRGVVVELVDPGARGLDVVVSVPDGEQMAKRTTNERLGIVGGISILGTTGIVRPFSTASWRASALQAIDVMAATDQRRCVLSTGGRTEQAAMRLLPDLDETCFVEVGDFTGAAVARAVERGITEVVFVGMPGKLTKLGAGTMMTHYTRSRVDTEYLAEVTRRAGGDADLVDAVTGANTARHAYELWSGAGLARAAGDVLCGDVAANLQAWAAQHDAADRFRATAVLVDVDSLEPVGASPDAASLLTAGQEAGGG